MTKKLLLLFIAATDPIGYSDSDYSDTVSSFFLLTVIYFVIHKGVNVANGDCAEADSGKMTVFCCCAQVF